MRMGSTHPFEDPVIIQYIFIRSLEHLHRNGSKLSSDEFRRHLPYDLYISTFATTSITAVLVAKAKLIEKMLGHVSVANLAEAEELVDALLAEHASRTQGKDRLLSHVITLVSAIHPHLDDRCFGDLVRYTCRRLESTCHNQSTPKHRYEYLWCLPPVYRQRGRMWKAYCVLSVGFTWLSTTFFLVSLCSGVKSMIFPSGLNSPGLSG